MGHNLNFQDGKASMFSVRQVPWHGLGTILENAPRTVQEALTAAQLDWEVGLKPVFCADGSTYCEVPNYKAIVRLDQWGKQGCRPFALVGNDYKVLQNREAFEFFEPLVESGRVTFETAGALGDGERVWVLAKLRESQAEIAQDDNIERYLMLSTGHDAKTAVQVRFTPVRIVCQNTLTMALSRGTDFAKTYHVSGMKRVLLKAREDVGVVLTEYESLEQSLRKMAQRRLSMAEAAAYILAVFPDPKRRKGQSDESFGRACEDQRRRRRAALKYFHEGHGNSQSHVSDTLWAAYNGIIEMLDHHTNYSTPYRRLESLMFGEEQRVKLAAYEEAMRILAA